MLKRLNGVRVADTGLYEIDFPYCRSVISDIKVFFLEIDKALSF